MKEHPILFSAPMPKRIRYHHGNICYDGSMIEHEENDEPIPMQLPALRASMDQADREAPSALPKLQAATLGCAGADDAEALTAPRWAAVPGFEGRYEVSTDGSVRSLSTYRADAPVILSPWKTPRGYLSISMREGERRRSFSVHRLVMAAFIGPCPVGMQVAHNNGERRDNRLLNLRYATPSSNIDDRRRHGRTARGSRNGSAVLDEAAAITIIKLQPTGLSASEVAHLACVNPSTVQAIWNGRMWVGV